jgi:hypothetical protein
MLGVVLCSHCSDRLLKGPQQGAHQRQLEFEKVARAAPIGPREIPLLNIDKNRKSG